MSKDYYKSLGVDQKASKDDIKKAFRNLAHKHHPDKGGDAEKFKEINEAYSVLSDDQKRAQYDQFGSGGPQFGGGGNSGGFGGFDFSGFSQGGQGGSFEFDLGDIFGDVFGGGRKRQQTKRGKDISIDVEISFEESIFGIEKSVLLHKTSTCEHCKGNGGEPGTETSRCDTCNGNGSLREVKQSFFGQFESIVECSTCKGKGKIPKTKCSTCQGAGVFKKQSEITIKIPAGIDNGEMLRLTGAGEAVGGGTSGDLYIKVHVKKHSYFKKEGYDLFMDLTIKITEAILGSTYTIKTLDGDILLKIPEGIKHGEYLKIKGKGVPNGSKRGDILVRIFLNIPTKISREARKKLEELQKEGI